MHLNMSEDAGLGSSLNTHSLGGWHRKRFDRFLAVVEEACSHIPRYQMLKLRVAVRSIYKRRFGQRLKNNRYESGEILTDVEFDHFVRCAPSKKFALLFKYQAFLGLRVGEICKLHTSNFDLDKMELILSDQSGFVSNVKIPHCLFDETSEFMDSYRNQIIEADGYLFFKDRESTNPEQHMNADYVRNVFRQTVEKANMEAIYDYSNETISRRRTRALHRFSTRSLSHYAIRRNALTVDG